MGCQMGEAEGAAFLQLRPSESLDACVYQATTVCANFWKPRDVEVDEPPVKFASRGASAGQDRFPGRKPDSSDSGWSKGTGHRGAGCRACLPRVRQRRYERIVLPKSLSATISSSWGNEHFDPGDEPGGGMGTKEDNLRIGSEANLDISLGVRHVRAPSTAAPRPGQRGGLRDRQRRPGMPIPLRGSGDAVERAPEGKSHEWDGARRVSCLELALLEACQKKSLCSRQSF